MALDYRFGRFEIDNIQLDAYSSAAISTLMFLVRNTVSLPTNLNIPIIDIFEIIQQPLVIIDEKCCITYANPAYYRTFRTFKEVTENCLLADVCNGDWNTPALTEELNRSVATGGRMEKFEVSKMFSILGAKKIVLDMMPVPGTENSNLFMLAFHDATESPESVWQSLIDSMQGLIYIYDLEQEKVNLINKASLKSLGYAAADIEQAATDLFSHQIHPEDLDKIKIHRQDILNLKDSESAVVEYRIRNGQNKWSHYLSNDLVISRDSSGKPTRYAGIATDISDISAANKILTRKNNALEASNNELYSFSSIASHDLKEPLRKIQMFGNFVMENESHKISDDSNRYLSRMIVAANRMQTLIDDLISYSRTDFDKNKFVDSDLNLLLDEVKEELKEAIEESGTTIEITTLGTASILPSQFRQLFINLISNSIKYCKKDCQPIIRIFARVAPLEEIELLNGAATHPFVKISIEDHGIGFDNVYKSKIFEPFQRLHNRSDYSGTGIGLSICKKIAENHSGFITAESDEGKGTRFDVYIPIQII